MGVLLPRNVVVMEREGGGTTVYALGPKAMMQLADLPALRDLAEEAQARIERALASLG